MNSFDGLNRLTMAKERIWVWGYLNRNHQNWKAEKKKTKNKQQKPQNPQTVSKQNQIRLSKNCRTTTKGVCVRNKSQYLKQ